jgi:hypothetical protein
MSLPENLLTNKQTNEKVCPKCGKLIERELTVCPNCSWTPKPQSKVSHGSLIASIISSVIGLFVFGYIFGLVGAVLGAISVSKKDNWGYVGIVLGTLVYILTIVSIIDILGYPGIVLSIMIIIGTLVGFVISRGIKKTKFEFK